MNRNPRNYGFSTYQRRDEPSEEKILVFDLGGGTFDVTVLHVINGSDSLTFRVLATGGDDMLGGTNFDEAFRDWALQEGEIDFSSVDERAKNRSMAGLLEEVIKIKQELSFVESTFLAVPNILPGQHLDLDVSQTRFNETIIDVCIANDPVVPAGTCTSGLPLEALRSLAMQGSIIRTLRFGEGAGDLPEFGSELRRNGPS